MEEQKVQENSGSKRQLLTLPVAIIIAGVLIAGAVYFRSGSGAANGGNQVKIENKKTVIKSVSDKDHILGNPDAELIMIEYSDTECPFCKVYQKTVNQIMQEYGKTGKVAWVYRHFPIEQLHSKAPHEAEAVECASEVGGKAKFWDYLNKVFETTPSNNGLDPAELSTIAKDLGIDIAAFNNCLSSGKYKDAIAQSIKDAQAAGADGTPFTVIVDKKGDTYPVNGALPYDNLKAIIDNLLKGN